MRDKKWYNQNRLRLEKGLPEQKPGSRPYLEELKETQWDDRFDQLARGKLLMGAFRYGKVTDNYAYDFMQAMKNKIVRYEQTHNLELLVDIRNYAMLEFKHPRYKDAYYENEDDTEHAPLKK